MILYSVYGVKLSGMEFTFHLPLSSTNSYCLLPLLRIRSFRQMKSYPIVYRTDMFCNKRYFSKIIFTWCHPIVAFIFCRICEGFKSMKNNTSKLQQDFNWWELCVCLNYILEGKGAFGRRTKNFKKIKIKRISCVNDSVSGDGFSPGSAVSNVALFGDACLYHPDSETGERFLIPCYMLLYFCLKA